MIGRGSYGEVWLASDALKKWRAVKVVFRGEHSQAEHEYKREFEALQRYDDICGSHRSLMFIRFVGRDPADRFFFYGMDLADDTRTRRKFDPLPERTEQIASSIQDYEPRTMRAELSREGRLTPKECLDHAVALATALEQLHGHNLIHRDIKPDNIIFVDGEPKLADIGLVTNADAKYSLAGTRAYWSSEPERKQPADIFALGKVIYEMATGEAVENFPRLPDGFATLAQDERTALNELSAVFCKACEPQVHDRYTTAKQMREDLELVRDRGSVIRQRELEGQAEVLRQQVEQERRRRTSLVRKAWAGGAVFSIVVVLGLLLFRVRVTNERVAEESRRRVLRELRISRIAPHVAGWSADNMSRLGSLGPIGQDQESLEQATAALTGLDSREVRTHQDMPASSAAFAPDGSALFGGVGTSRALLMDLKGALTELPAQGEGPVCWTRNGVALLFTVVSNTPVLLAAQSGDVRREFLLTDDERLASPFRRVLAMTPDGTRVAAGMEDKVVAWEAASGARIGEVRCAVTSLAFSPDGLWLAAGDLAGTTRVYEVPGFAETAVLPAPLRGNPIFCLAFGRDPVVRNRPSKRKDSWLLATGGKSGSIIIWDITRRLPRSFCLGSPWYVESLAFHPDGSTLASAGRNEARLWDVVSGQVFLRLPGVVSSGGSRALAFDDQGRRLVLGGEAGAGRAAVALREFESNRGIQILRGLGSACRKVWFSRDSLRVAGLSDDWQLGVWEAGTGRLLVIFETPVGTTADNAGGCFDPSGNRFAFATGNEACLYDLVTVQVAQRWPLGAGKSDQIQFDNKGRLLLLRREQPAEDRKSIWRLHELNESEQPRLLRQQTETNWTAMGMAFRAGGEQFLVWNGPPDTDRVIRAYDIASGREYWKAAADASMNYFQVFLDTTGRWFGYVALTNPRTTRLMDFSTLNEIGMTKEFYEAVSPSGRQFAGGGHYHLDREGRRHAIPIAADLTMKPYVWNFSPDGRFLACGTYEGPILLADLPEVERRLDSMGKPRR